MLRMYNEETGDLHATYESLEVFFNPTTRKSMPIAQELYPFLEEQIKGGEDTALKVDLPRNIQPVSNWLETHTGVCFPWHCDQFKHMNVRWYAHAFDDGMFHLWPKLGVSWHAMEEKGVHTVTASTTTYFQKELQVGNLFKIEGGVVHCGNKSVTFSQRMVNVETLETHASQTVTEVFFDPKTRKAAPIPEVLKEVIQSKLS